VAAILGLETEPDLRTDDVMFRNVRDARAGTLSDPQPKFGIPLGPVVGGAGSDYLHAQPGDRYRSTFHPMRNPDLVKDDLAFRHLRKDDQLTSDPSQLGIAPDPHGVIRPQRTWRPPSSRSSPPGFRRSYYSAAALGNGVLGTVADSVKHAGRGASRSLATGMALVIRKQSAKPSAGLNDLISYRDLRDPAGYDCMRYSLDTVLLRRSESVGQQQLLAAADRKGKQAAGSSSYSKGGGVTKQPRRRPQSTPALGRTVYEILRGARSPEESEKEKDEGGIDGMTSDVETGENEMRKGEGDCGDCQQEVGDDSTGESSEAGGKSVEGWWLQLSQLPEVVTDSIAAAASSLAATSADSHKPALRTSCTAVDEDDNSRDCVPVTPLEAEDEGIEAPVGNLEDEQSCVGGQLAEEGGAESQAG
jgi:hypothetical protein